MQNIVPSNNASPPGSFSCNTKGRCTIMPAPLRSSLLLWQRRLLLVNLFTKTRTPMNRQRNAHPILSPLLTFAATLLFTSTVFAGGPTEFTVLSFPGSGAEGSIPYGKLASDSAGNLYGTTALGGTFASGTVFELLKPVPPSIKWTETVLYNFTGGSDGSQPNGDLIFDSAGNLYGTAWAGGTINDTCGGGCGTVFELSPPATSGNPWTLNVLHSFLGGSDGSESVSGVVFDQHGNLFGTTAGGGRGGVGTVFTLAAPTTAGQPWTETVLYTFYSSQYPRSTPVFDAKGNLYGTTYTNNTSGDYGVAFRLAPPAVAGGAWSYKVIHQFGSAPDGQVPGVGLTLYKGLLYGTTYAGGLYGNGTVFQLAPSQGGAGAWTETTLYNLGTAASDGNTPSSSPLFDNAGNIYVTTGYGGSSTNLCGSAGCGTVFKLTPPASGGAWTETLLHTFTGGNDGGSPWGGLLLGKNSAVYGTAESGGSGEGSGVVFGIAP